MDLHAILESYNDVLIAIQHGADMNQRNDQGNTPLHTAAYKGYANVMKLLLISGAMVDAENANGDAPLHLAVKQQHIDCVVLLIKYGCNLFHANKDDKTAMSIAKELDASDIENVLVRKLIEMI